MNPDKKELIILIAWTLCVTLVSCFVTYVSFYK